MELEAWYFWCYYNCLKISLSDSLSLGPQHRSVFCVFCMWQSSLTFLLTLKILPFLPSALIILSSVKSTFTLSKFYCFIFLLIGCTMLDTSSDSGATWNAPVKKKRFQGFPISVMFAVVFFSTLYQIKKLSFYYYFIKKFINMNICYYIS